MAQPSKPFPLEEEYKKETGITKEDIAGLRKWLETQPHLPKEYITDLDLILTYHSCDRSPSVTKQVLDLHYTLRTLFTSFFKDRYMDVRVEFICTKVVLHCLPARTKDGYAVIYGGLLDTDPKNFFYRESIRTVLMLIDLWQYEEGTWPGFIILFDLRGIKPGHLPRLDFQTLQQFFYYLQEAMVVKFKGMHFLNAPSFMDKLMMLLKPFMKKELMEMIGIHQTGSRTLDEYYNVDALPLESGGKYKSIEECRDETIAKLKANKRFFEEENKKRVVESQRPDKPKTITDIFGSVEGSFKKLSID